MPSGVRRRPGKHEEGGPFDYLSNAKPRRKRFQCGLKHILIVALATGVIYFAMNWLRQYQSLKQVYTPLSSPKVFDENDNQLRFWGTYRPQVYFGMKTRSAKSLVTGMMWLEQYIPYNIELPLRHACDQGDKLPRYGWIAHDGNNFGIQDITERRFNLRTEFVKRPGGKHGGEWTWRVSGRGTEQGETAISLFFYAATDRQGTVKPILKETKNGEKMTAISGYTDELGEFTINFRTKDNPKNRFHHTVVKVNGLHSLKDGVLKKLRRTEVTRFGGGDRKFTHYSLMSTQNIGNSDNPTSTAAVYQVTLETPFAIEVVFKSGSCQQDRRMELSGDVFQKELLAWNTRFEQRFETRFPLKSKEYNPEQISFAKAAFSNMIGGMGYFHGHSFVQSPLHEHPVPYWDAPLYTAVPSRSFFPRGFLWDEGFHQILLSKWDRGISEEAIGSWLDLINVEGWIPREQILDDEARSKVPSEFVVQHSENANPPTLYLAILSIIDGIQSTSYNKTKDENFLRRIYPRLQKWYDWFNTTQIGPISGTYRWRGRTIINANVELNPKTLTSGLDDFPRSSHPSEDERHLDLRCWMALASDAMANIAKLVQQDPTPYIETHQYLSDNTILDKLHWSNKLQRYADYGNHSSKVSLVRKTFQSAQPGQPPTSRVIRNERDAPQLGFVDADGYVNLFPFLLQILSPYSQKLGIILRNLKNTDKLWTKYGLRSLSKSDPLYMKRNTEHDPPYWRGQIWINMNFLAIRALKHYSVTLSENSDLKPLAKSLYTELRENVISNIFKQYQNTGYIWENYNDNTGAGNGCHPFTGWSALVVLIMSEQY